MGLNRHDVWGHFAPMFHLVDVFAVYAITLVGGRHVTLPTFSAQDVLLAIGGWAPSAGRGAWGGGGPGGGAVRGAGAVGHGPQPSCPTIHGTLISRYQGCRDPMRT